MPPRSVRARWLVRASVNPLPLKFALPIGRRWRQSRDVLPPTERIKFEWTTAESALEVVVAFAVIIKSVSLPVARGPRMDMKKRIHLELRNRTPSDVSGGLASFCDVSLSLSLMENISCWCLGGVCVWRGQSFLQVKKMKGAVWSHCCFAVVFTVAAGPTLQTFARLQPFWCAVWECSFFFFGLINKASGTRSHICNVSPANAPLSLSHSAPCYCCLLVD